MRKYEFVTLKSYVESLEDKNYVLLNDKALEVQVEKYLLSLKRAESNAKVVEALVG